MSSLSLRSCAVARCFASAFASLKLSKNPRSTVATNRPAPVMPDCSAFHSSSVKSARVAMAEMLLQPARRRHRLVTSGGERRDERPHLGIGVQHERSAPTAPELVEHRQDARSAGLRVPPDPPGELPRDVLWAPWSHV